MTTGLGDGNEGAERSAPGREMTRTAVQALMARMSRILGATTADTLDAGIEECLLLAGEATGVDLAVVVLVDDEERITDDWRWVRAGHDVVPPAMGSPLRETFGSGIEVLRLGHGFAVDDLAGIDLGPEENAIVAANRLRSVLAAPVRVGTTFLGMLALMHLDHPRPWRETQVSQIEIMGALVGQAVQRTRDRGQLAAANARARRIAEHLPDGLVLVDPRGDVTWVSPAFERTSGRSAAELVGHGALDLVHPDDQQRLAAAMYQQPERGDGISVRVQSMSEWRWTDLSWTLMRDADQAIEDELVVSLRDVHEKHLRNEALARRSRQDVLTGTLNRVGLDDALAAMDPAGQQILVGFVDVDAFKSVNDSSGHGAGDEVLRSVAHALRRGVRASDHVARLGGDEFCVVACCGEGANCEPALLAARLLAAVRSSLDHAATVSIGVAGPGCAADAAELMAAADAAMYRAKRAGGDRWVLDEAARG